MGENYKPKIVKAKLKTGGKTVQSVREKLTGQGFTVRDFQHIIKTGEYFDEVEVLEVIQEETNEIEPGTVDKAVRTTRAIKEQQYYHRKKKRAAQRNKPTYHRKKHR